MGDADPRVQPSPEPPAARAAKLSLAILAGAVLAMVAVPRWAPAMASSLAGEEPHACWYLSRASGVVAYVLLWLSVTAGLLSSSGIGRRLVGGPVLYDAHRHAAWLGLAFAAFHVLVLMGDRYLGADLVTLLVPFAMTRYERGWVGLGQIAIYGGVLISLSFSWRGKLGPRTWRALHFASFTVYALTLAHGVFAGTDASSPALAALFAGSGAIVTLLTAIRLVEAKR